MIRVIIFIILLAGCMEKSSDFMLENVFSHMPEDWTYSTVETLLTIHCETPVWIIHENKLNAPIDILSEKRDQEYFMKYGKQIYPEIVFKIVRKQEIPGVKKMISDNDKIRNEIDKLPYSMNIDHLIDRHLSSKGTIFFKPVTENEKAMVAAYFQKIKELEGRISKVPDYETELYYLFIQKESVLNDEFTSAYPENIVEDYAAVRSLLEKYRCR